jgi:cytochrome b subunit of formate dehydrogenase
VGWIASLLGFGVSIVAGILIYAFAFDGAVWLVEQVTGPTDAMTRYIIAFAMIFIFVAIAARVGRFARDWIEAGRAYDRRPAR